VSKKQLKKLKIMAAEVKQIIKLWELETGKKYGDPANLK